jgi:hypothetical protein
MENSSEEYLEYLILNGYVEVAGIDEEGGEFLYSFTENAKSEIPGLKEQISEEFYKVIVYLWEQGFLDMDISSENPLVRITPKALEKTEVDLLPKLYRNALITIAESLRL